MSDMNTSVDYRVDGTNASAVHDFDGGDADSAAEAETSAELPSGYVSDAELIAWLQTKSTHQSNELRAEMKLSTGRQELIDDLNNLKTSIEHCTTNEAANEVAAEMQQLLEKYKGTPYIAELAQLLAPAIDVIEVDGTTGWEVNMERLSDPLWLASSGLPDRIASETDKLGKVDSLALVQIQQLVSDAKETSQLASNVLSSRDQAASSIIGNIRG
jgi:hypothetical protein